MPSITNLNRQYLFSCVPLDVDECALGIDNCSKQQVCTYSYTHRRISKSCRPVATCTDTPTGFQCTCNEGFSGDGIICRGIVGLINSKCMKINDCMLFVSVDINECARNTDNCHPNARCWNKIGGFHCRCRYFYIGDGVDCCIRRSEVSLFGRGRWYT